MANNAMKLTKDNLDFVERFDSVLVRVHNEWLKCLWDFAESRKISLYVVLAYRFEDMKFVHESTTIMESENFHRRFVFVEEDKPGYTQVLLRDYVEE